MARRSPSVVMGGNPLAVKLFTAATGKEVLKIAFPERRA